MQLNVTLKELFLRLKGLNSFLGLLRSAQHDYLWLTLYSGHSNFGDASLRSA
jgi:hypothetical protein